MKITFKNMYSDMKGTELVSELTHELHYRIMDFFSKYFNPRIIFWVKQNQTPIVTYSLICVYSLGKSIYKCQLKF